jgi:ABC-2 type transport system ATP-binding protein
MRSGRVGFVAQDAPTYAGLTVADHLSLGAGLNPRRWDAAAAGERVRRLGLPPQQKAGRLSGGQRAQLALTLALSKRPDLLVLDEPVASLDPLARRAFLNETVAAATVTGTAVVLATHLVADLAQTCTHVVVVAGGRIRLAAAIADLAASPAELERVVLGELGRSKQQGDAA